MFPKVLHQTWRTKDLSGVPEFQACANSWVHHHADYQHVLWDDQANEEFVKSRFSWYYDTWRSFDKNIKRLDSIRYMWMYEHGGVYADLDLECLKPMQRLFECHQAYDTILFCDLDTGGQCLSANPALLVSQPGSKLWLEILDYARENSGEYVTHCTGPFALGHVINTRAKRFRIKSLDQNRLFIRKSNKDFYANIPGNERDSQIYDGVFCTTSKPPKYYEDKQHKYVADWHGTPERFRWHNEYARDSAGTMANLTGRIRRLFHKSTRAISAKASA